MVRIRIQLLLVFAWLSFWQARVSADAIDEARLLYQRGRYAEAFELAAANEQLHRTDAIVLQAEIHAEQGQEDRAETLLKQALATDGKNQAWLHALLRVYSRRAKYGVASEECLKPLAEENSVVGHWLRMKSHELLEEFEPLQREARWFADRNEEIKTASAQDSIMHAQGLLMHARWSHESKWFDIAVNKVLANAEKEHPYDWRVPYERAICFAEKHNDPAAFDALNAALAKNGSAAELHALRARFAVDSFNIPLARRAIEQARQCNPHLASIALLEADIAFAELQPSLAIALLEKGGVSAEVRGRLVAAKVATTPASPHGEVSIGSDDEKLATESVLGLLCQGDALERMRRFSQARDAFQNALVQCPSYPGIRANLALEQLRMGEETAGGELLKQAFQEDPFDVRVKNSIAVLEVLSTYATLETEHFIIRFDRGSDELLAKYAAMYLETEVYPDLVRLFNFKPAGKSLIEIYNRARTTSGHGWFSARMVGVPGLHTVGACGGKIVALASPTDMPKPYNWARVLRHEFVHLLNLEQTSFNVPHWVTEGLAVSAEGRPRPASWQRLLTQRLRDDKLYTLDNINFGFIRPSNSDDWTAAYAQAELYIAYLASRFGDESIGRLLSAYAENLTTTAAIEKATGISSDGFETGFRDYVTMEIERWNLMSSTASTNLERLKTQLRDDPHNAALLAELAACSLAAGDVVHARLYAARARAADASQQQAAFVLATLAVKENDRKAAEEIAQAVIDLKQPHEGLLLLLAKLKIAKNQPVLAEKLLVVGKAKFPTLGQWNVLLAQIYAKSDQAEKLIPVLSELSTTEEDDASIPARLTAYAAQRKDYPSMQKWAAATLYIDVHNATAHAALAEVNQHEEKFSEARFEWRAAIDDCKPGSPNKSAWMLQLVRVLIKQGERAEAEKLLEQIVVSSPNLPGLVEVAQELRR